MDMTYLTTSELSSLIKYDVRTIREQLIGDVLVEGRHFFRPFGRGKILFVWENIKEDMFSDSSSSNPAFSIPMANGGVCHG